MMIVKSSWEYIYPKSLYVAVFFCQEQTKGEISMTRTSKKKLTGAYHTRFLLQKQHPLTLESTYPPDTILVRCWQGEFV